MTLLSYPDDSIASTTTAGPPSTNLFNSRRQRTSEGSPTSVRMFSNTATTTTTITTNNDDDCSPRSCILQVGVSTGRLCGVANSHLLLKNFNTTDQEGKPETTRTNPSFPARSTTTTALVLAMSDLLIDLYRTSRSLELDLIVSVNAKLELNRKKYPVELCKGKSTKYTQYSQVTGVTKTNQSTSSFVSSAPSSFASTTFFTPAQSLSQLIEGLPDLAKTIQDFAQARAWAPFHTPRNLVLALLGEVGELAEILQWEGDMDNNHNHNNDNDDVNGSPNNSTKKVSKEQKDKLSQELADVTIYLLRLATVTNTVAELVETLTLQVEDEGKAEDDEIITQG